MLLLIFESSEIEYCLGHGDLDELYRHQRVLTALQNSQGGCHLISPQEKPFMGIQASMAHLLISARARPARPTRGGGRGSPSSAAAAAHYMFPIL